MKEIAPTFEAFKGRAQALYVVGDAPMSTNRVRINTLEQYLPSGDICTATNCNVYSITSSARASSMAFPLLSDVA